MGMFRIITDVSKLMFNINIPDLTKLMLKEARWKIKNKKIFISSILSEMMIGHVRIFSSVCYFIFIYFYLKTMSYKTTEQLHTRINLCEEKCECQLFQYLRITRVVQD